MSQPQRNHLYAFLGFSAGLVLSLLFLGDLLPGTDGLLAWAIDGTLTLWILWSAMGALGIDWIVEPGAHQRLMQAAPIAASWIAMWIGGIFMIGLSYLCALCGTAVSEAIATQIGFPLEVPALILGYLLFAALALYFVGIAAWLFGFKFGQRLADMFGVEPLSIAPWPRVTSAFQDAQPIVSPVVTHDLSDQRAALDPDGPLWATRVDPPASTRIRRVR